MSTKKKRLGDLLVEEGLIDRYQLQSALAEQRKWGGRLGKHLIDLGILSEDVLVKALSKLLALPSVDVGGLTVPRAVIDYVPVKTAERFHLIPINVIEPTRDGSGPARRTLVVAMSDPTNLAAVDEVQFTSGCDVRTVVSGDGAIERAIKVYYHGISPEEASRAAGHGPNLDTDEQSWEIVSSGNVRSVNLGDSAVVPRDEPDEFGSITSSDLQPIPAEEAPQEMLRRVNALLRVLIKKGILTEEEIAEELEKL